MKTIVKDYEMFSNAGNKSCDALVKRMEKKIKGKLRLSEEQITKMVSEGVKKIAVKHPEVTDTEPSYYITAYVNKFCKEVGYDYNISRYNL
jgi:hypothetical protein